ERGVRLVGDGDGPVARGRQRHREVVNARVAGEVSVCRGQAAAIVDGAAIRAGQLHRAGVPGYGVAAAVLGGHGHDHERASRGTGRRGEGKLAGTGRVDDGKRGPIRGGGVFLGVELLDRECGGFIPGHDPAKVCGWVVDPLLDIRGHTGAGPLVATDSTYGR